MSSCFYNYYLLIFFQYFGSGRRFQKSRVRAGEMPRVLTAGTLHVNNLKNPPEVAKNDKNHSEEVEVVPESTLVSFWIT